MGDRINIMDIKIDNFTAKEAMKRFVELVQTDPIGVIEMVSADSVIRLDEFSELKEGVCRFDLVLAADRTILESAHLAERRRLQETEKQVFLRMVLRYLHKNHKRVYLLVESEEEGREAYDYLADHYRGTQVAGMAKVAANDRADQMIVNSINGADADCVISMMDSPLQEEFITANRKLLNARVWLGLGKAVPVLKRTGQPQNRFVQFLVKRVFQKEMERRRTVQDSLSVAK